MFKKFLIFTVTIILIFSLSGLSAFALGSTPDGSTQIYIRAVKSGKYIDVPNGTVSNKKEVQIHPGNQTNAQKWYYVKYQDGLFSLRSAIDSNYYLSMNGNAASNGTKLVIEYFAPGTPIPSRAIFGVANHDEYGVGLIFSKENIYSGSQLCVLETQSGNIDNGTKIIQHTAYETADTAYNQFWVFEGTSRTQFTNFQDLVDSGRHCDYDGTTKYQNLINISTTAWNNYAGATIFRKNSITNLKDVTFYDKTSSPSGPSVLAATFPDKNKIEFYTTPMDNLDGVIIRTHTVMHELGHALGLSHSANGLGNVMCQGGLAYRTSLSLDDLQSFKVRSAQY